MLDFVEYMLINASKNEASYTFTINGVVTTPFKLEVSSIGHHMFVRDKESISMDKVAFYPTEVNIDRPYLICQNAVKQLKAGALKESIRRELDSMAEAVSHYYDYYKDADSVLQVYILRDYVTNQVHDYPVLVKFDRKDDRMDSIKDHKLKGLVARNVLSEGTVTMETLEAWRYTKLDWKCVRDLSHTFYNTVLRGGKP